METSVNTKSRMENMRNYVAILILVGFVIFIYTTSIGNPSAIFWLFTIAFAVIFYFNSGKFLSKPEIGQIKSLERVFYGFIIMWILALVIGLNYSSRISASTIIGLLLCLGATYLIQQFISDAKTLAKVEPSSH